MRHEPARLTRLLEGDAQFVHAVADSLFCASQGSADAGRVIPASAPARIFSSSSGVQGGLAIRGRFIGCLFQRDDQPAEADWMRYRIP